MSKNKLKYKLSPNSIKRIEKIHPIENNINIAVNFYQLRKFGDEKLILNKILLLNPKH